jgi:hypothetical protein
LHASQAPPHRLGSGIDKHRKDYTVYSGGWKPAAVPSICWFWSLTINGPMMRSGRVASLEEAKAQLQKSWDAWKAWAKLEEAPGES